MSTDSKSTNNVIHVDFRAAARARDAAKAEADAPVAKTPTKARKKKAGKDEVAAAPSEPATAADAKVAAFPAVPAPTATRASLTVELDPSEKSEFNRRKAIFFADVINYGVVSITFDARVEGVKMPASLASKPEVVLNFSKNFHIADFDYNADYVRATLSFEQGDTLCEIPWRAVWMILSKPAVAAYAVPFDASAERRPTVTGILRSVRTMLEQLPSSPGR